VTWPFSKRQLSPPSLPPAEPQDSTKQYVDAMLEEYKTLRAESLNSIDNRITILLSSFTSLSIITSATVIAQLPSLIVAAILAVAVPTLAKTLALVWLGEYRRSQRAGAALVILETRINEAIGRKTLSWEASLRGRKAKISVPYLYTVIVLLTIAYLSEFLALHYIYVGSKGLALWTGQKYLNGFAVTGAAAGLFVIVELLSFLGIRSEWQQARSASL